MDSTALEGGACQKLFEVDVELFLRQLRAAGYAQYTLRKKRVALRSLARWAQQRGIAAADLHDRDVDAFLACSSGRPKEFVATQRRAIRQFLRFVRTETGDDHLPAPKKISTAGDLLRDYEDYLRGNRGLAENSIRVYIPFIRSFLVSPNGRTDRVSRRWLNTLAIRDFVLRHIQDRSGEYIRLLGAALRSFLRFLFLSGRIAQDLSLSVPTIRRYRQAVPPAFLSPEEVERVLAKTDRSTSTGRRDYAILLLLARLGVRAGEIVALELDDLLWRTGEIVIHGKGNIVDRLPLLSEIGEAVTVYIREDRGASASRRVFLRTWAPRIGLTGPAAIGHIVRLALARAEIHRSGRGAAHLFRHGLATKMIRHGASMAEIAELLRHRSQTTTAIYAQVSFESLRTVALPWPVAGGER
jgi:site-specific recombinase XerD